MISAQSGDGVDDLRHKLAEMWRRLPSTIFAGFAARQNVLLDADACPCFGPAVVRRRLIRNLMQWRKSFPA